MATLEPPKVVNLTEGAVLGKKDGEPYGYTDSELATKVAGTGTLVTADGLDADTAALVEDAESAVRTALDAQFVTVDSVVEGVVDVTDPAMAAVVEDTDSATFESLNKVFGRVYNPLYFGARFDGSTDDTTAIQAAVDACKVTGGTVILPAGTTIISAPIEIDRGVRLCGAGSVDNTAGTVIKLADGANCSMIRTPMAGTGDTADATHYMILEGIRLDGNAQNQTVEAVAVDFRGAYIGSHLRDVVIANAYGTALWLSTCDLIGSNIWVHGTVNETGGYAVIIGDPNDADYTSNLLHLEHFFVENTVNEKGLSATAGRDDTTKQGKGVLICQSNRVTGVSWHMEAQTPNLEIGDDVKHVEVVGFSNAWATQCVHFSALPFRFVRFIGLSSEEQADVTMISRDAGLSASIDEITASSSSQTYIPEWMWTSGNSQAATPEIHAANRAALALVSHVSGSPLSLRVASGGSPLITGVGLGTGGGMSMTFDNVARDLIRAFVSGQANARLAVTVGGQFSWGPGTGAADTTLSRNGTGRLSTQSLDLSGILRLTGSTGQYIEIVEQGSDPAAPSANGARIFTRDDGTGKTELCVRFATGDVQVIAAEP